MNLARLLIGCSVEELNDVQSRASGAASARSGTDDPIDASVVVGAIARNDLVLTSDRGDMRAIADALGKRLNHHLV